MPRRRQAGFIWIPPTRTTFYDISIGGTSIKSDIIDAKFTRGVIGEDMGCEISLENSGEQHNDLYTFGDVIQFKMDFNDGSTVQWEGELEEQQKQLNDVGYTLKIKGSHYTSKLLDVTVTAEFTDATADSVLKSITDDFLTGFTYNNVKSTSTTVTITWNNKPFFDCILDLMSLAGFDCYIDNDKDIHFFETNSINNDNEAVVWNDGLYELQGLGPDSVDVRNKTTVYGESDGLPVIATSEDSASQTTYGVKERIIRDTSISDESVALSTGNAEVAIEKDPPTKGSALNMFMPTLVPGDNIYVVYPPQNVHARYRVVNYTMRIPNETVEINFSKETTIPQLFKDRQKAELRAEPLTNPFKMKHSYNFSFDDESKVDASSSSTYSITDGFAQTDGSSTGIVQSIAKTTPITVSSVHLKVIGDNISGNVYEVSADGGNAFQTITPETETTITSTGTSLIVKITFNSADARLDALALLYK